MPWINMVDQFCFQCGKKVIRFLKYGIESLGDFEIPNGMKNGDKICSDCYEKLPESKESQKRKELERREKEIQKEKKRQQEKENSEEYGIIKSNLNKHQTIIYKDDYCAIIKKNEDLSFIKAFRNLTREGYRMMAQDEGSQFHLGIASVGAGSYYFFQKIEYIILRDI